MPTIAIGSSDTERHGTQRNDRAGFGADQLVAQEARPAPAGSGSRRPAWRAAAAPSPWSAGCAARPRSASRSRAPGTPRRVDRRRPDVPEHRATWPRTRSSSASALVGVAERGPARPQGDSAVCDRATARRERVRISPRSSGGTSPGPRSTAEVQPQRQHDRGAGRDRGVEQRQAVFRGQRGRCRPRPAAPRRPGAESSPPSAPQHPRRATRPGRPSARRCSASASRNALAAA